MKITLDLTNRQARLVRKALRKQRGFLVECNERCTNDRMADLKLADYLNAIDPAVCQLTEAIDAEQVLFEARYTPAVAA